ncbi:Uncharacterised protein [Burkholderia pseudomallei]|nr:Uncharacterised protein [Burkholderia pseudomallei]CAJ9833491.1 Uncharacterised protein [Burkholderia pseudomallei]
MEPSIIAAAASVSAALIALFGAVFNRRKTEQAAEQARLANEALSERLKKIDVVQQNQLALLKSEMDRIGYIANVNHSKRAEVLTETYAKLADIKLLMERFVVPMFAHSSTGNAQTLTEAAHKFEELYRFCSMKAVYFSMDSKVMEALGQLMGYINHMQNLAQTDASSWKQQASMVIDGVNPILGSIRTDIRRELKLDL